MKIEDIPTGQRGYGESDCHQGTELYLGGRRLVAKDDCISTDICGRFKLQQGSTHLTRWGSWDYDCIWMADSQPFTVNT